MVPHPTKSGLWKIVGRADDQITLSTGEKVISAVSLQYLLIYFVQTSPIPLESAITQDPHVLLAIMFGHGRLQNGVIIQPKPQFTFHVDPTDEKKVAAFRNLVWYDAACLIQVAMLRT